MRIVCKGCGEDANGVKSHIIPESFFRELRGSEDTLKIISNTPGQRPKKSPIGVYDTTILCKKCEQVFAIYDDYGAKILLKENNFEKIESQGRLIGYQITELDYNLLKLFFISILWRASISNMPFYDNVNLGALEFKAKKHIWSKTPLLEHDFSFVLAKFSGEATLDKAIFNPHSERWCGVLYYRFYLAGYILYIKASSEITPMKFRKFISSNGSLDIVCRGPLASSKEHDILSSGNF